MTALSLEHIEPSDGWCDDPAAVFYNTLVTLPVTPYSAEQLWREDGLYDLFAVIEYNTTPVETGKGSAIFFHVASEGYGPTAGCISLQKKDLETIFEGIKSNDDSFILIEHPDIVSGR
jgi:L,D-peptidoglycan transpeptidase YkuD (ErfK/YbiS/YcfS/YnhG family)